MEANWHQFVAEVKQYWGRLSDDDLHQREGNRDRLVGKLHDLYGMTPDQAGEGIAHIER